MDDLTHPGRIFMLDVEGGNEGMLQLDFPRTDRVVLRITAQEGADEAAITLDLCRLLASLSCGQRWMQPPSRIGSHDHGPPPGIVYTGHATDPNMADFRHPLEFFPTAQEVPITGPLTAWTTLAIEFFEVEQLGQIARATGVTADAVLRTVIAEAYARFESELP